MILIAGSLRDDILINFPREDEICPEDSDSGDSGPFIRRRRRTQSVVSDIDDHQSQHVTVSDDSAAESEDEAFNGITEVEARPQDRRQLGSIRAADFVYPPSLYEGYIPPIEPSTEQDVINDFVEEMQREKPQANTIFDDKDFVEFDLSDFSIYLPDSVAQYPGTMTGLQNLAAKTANSWYCFDGILSLGPNKKYVQRIPFKLCSIGNYGCEIDSVGDEIWIQSDRNQRSEIYYRLRTPSAEYSRYHEGFVWLANLAKHFVDYLEHASRRHIEVSIHNFKADFVRLLEKMHRTSPIYQAWYSQYNRRDFRSHIAANIEFLWKETNGISKALLRHPIWKEVKSMDFIPMQKLRAKGTVVTPYVHDCFKHLKFGDQLSQVAPSSGVQYRRKSLGRTLQLTTDVSTATCPSNVKPQVPFDKKTIAVGDVLGVPMDDKGTSLWKDEASKWKTADDCWYVLVQAIHVDKLGKQSYDIIWLYKPSDTTCAKMKYPYNKELFLSDNCSCDTQRIEEDEVLFKVSIDWNGLPGDTNSDFFIRQTYLRNNAFVTLKECHKRCVHLRDEIKTDLQELVDIFKVGDTVLYIPPPHLKPKYGLEPGEIVEFLQHGSNGFVTIRRLLRRHDFDGDAKARPNELVYSDETCTVSASRVKRKCFVRFYTPSEVQQRAIPAPYNRDGTGDAFYISTRLLEKELEPVHSALPLSLNQGPDFRSTPSQERLRGLDLYCGGGNFGRGLEEGGAIRNTHAVDLDSNAIHTYWANLEDRKATKLFYGSVNDMLTEALKGNPSKSDLIPLPGDIDFISAGSPCPGFSVLNALKDNAQGLRNQSLVASVAAYIDVYRPKYALLENVVTMAQKGKRRDEDVLSQLICCIVGMGYQVQVFNLDAWSFGSPQSRCRLFVSIAAPGLEPPPHPSLSHSHPDGTTDRGLGLMASGHSFGERLFKPTPFDYVTAQEATADLPDIGDGRTYHCSHHPDHRMARGIPQKMKAQIEVIPINPRGMNFARTLKQGLMTRAERNLFPTLTRKGRPCHNVAPTSHAWERIHPQKLFPTIATSASPGCARTGRCLHWNQQRLITVLEARRAQGFPDDEVLTGLQAKQWRIIGNSVARTVSLALGLSIGEACRKNLLEEQNLEPVEVVIKKLGVSDVGSTMASFVSALEDLDQVATDSAVRSEGSYRQSLDTLGLKSSVNGGDTSSTSGSTNLSDEPVTKVYKRKHNISPPVTQPRAEKRTRLLRPSSKRDPTPLQEPDESMVVRDDSTSDAPEPVHQKRSRARGIIHTKRPSWQHGQQKLHRTPRAEKMDLLKKKRVDEATNESTPSEFEDHHSSRSTSEVPTGPQTSRPAKKLQTLDSTTSDPTAMSKLRSIHNNREATPKYSRKTLQKAAYAIPEPSIPASTSKPKEVIVIDSSGEEGSEQDDDENVIFVSSTKRKRVQPYVPVDNNMFIAYERTNQTMRLGARRR
jgi:DNA (cytosine-5)-methyltransferase 1